MGTGVIARIAIGTLLLAAPVTAGFAQMAWVPGSEITGHAVQIERNGVTNTVYFDPGGVARIQAPDGAIVPATWSAADGMLCLGAAGAQECFPYTSAFHAGQPVVLSSACGMANFVPISTAPPPMPVDESAGERG